MQNPNVNFALLSVEAQLLDYGWEWESWHTVEKGIVMDADEITPCKILQILRDDGFLSEIRGGYLIEILDKGRAYVRMENEICEGYLIEVLDSATRQPVFALSSIH